LTEPIIRLAEPADLSAIREVCLKTADAGKDGTALYQYPELLWALYADPYLVLSPETCFIAEDDQGVCGYTLSALDSEAIGSGFHRFNWLIRLLRPNRAGKVIRNWCN
jgi:hypothetical protein